MNATSDPLPGPSSTAQTPRAEHVGILALEVYAPRTYVLQEELEAYDGVPSGKYTSGLGQEKMAFCGDQEDVVSMSLTAVKFLLEKYEVDPRDIGRLEVGTESALDRSKSIKTFLMPLFSEAGNHDVEGVDNMNACYGGTAALFNAVNWVESRAWDGRLALVVAADIAMYAAGPARPAGGCGAVALLVGPNAPLDLERGLSSSYMEHAYDFYKPCGLYPLVDGQWSVLCYLMALDKCYTTMCRKYEQLAVRRAGQKRSLSLGGSRTYFPCQPLIQQLRSSTLATPSPTPQGQPALQPCNGASLAASGAAREAATVDDRSCPASELSDPSMSSADPAEPDVAGQGSVAQGKGVRCSSCAGTCSEGEGFESLQSVEGIANGFSPRSVENVLLAKRTCEAVGLTTGGSSVRLCNGVCEAQSADGDGDGGNRKRVEISRPQTLCLHSSARGGGTDVLLPALGGNSSCAARKDAAAGTTVHRPAGGISGRWSVGKEPRVHTEIPAATAVQLPRASGNHWGACLADKGPNSGEGRGPHTDSIANGNDGSAHVPASAANPVTGSQNFAQNPVPGATENVTAASPFMVRHKPDLLSRFAPRDGGTSDAGVSEESDEREAIALPVPANARFTLDEVDYVVFHSPYNKLVRKGFARLVYHDYARARWGSAPTGTPAPSGATGAQENHGSQAQRMLLDPVSSLKNTISASVLPPQADRTVLHGILGTAGVPSAIVSHRSFTLASQPVSLLMHKPGAVAGRLGDQSRGTVGVESRCQSGEALSSMGEQDQVPRELPAAPHPLDAFPADPSCFPETSYCNRRLEKASLAASGEAYAAKVQPSTDASRACGNMYAASLHLGLASLVEAVGEGLEGRRILMYSYGSGLVASLFCIRGRAVPGKFSLANVASQLHLRESLAARRKVAPAEFVATLELLEARYSSAGYKPRHSPDELRPGTYYLKEVDSQFRRTYARKL